MSSLPHLYDLKKIKLLFEQLDRNNIDVILFRYFFENILRLIVVGFPTICRFDPEISG